VERRYSASDVLSGRFGGGSRSIFTNRSLQRGWGVEGGRTQTSAPADPGPGPGLRAAFRAAPPLRENARRPMCPLKPWFVGARQRFAPFWPNNGPLFPGGGPVSAVSPSTRGAPEPSNHGNNDPPAYTARDPPIRGNRPGGRPASAAKRGTVTTSGSGGDLSSAATVGPILPMAKAWRQLQGHKRASGIVGVPRFWDYLGERSRLRSSVDYTSAQTWALSAFGGVSGGAPPGAATRRRIYANWALHPDGVKMVTVGVPAANAIGRRLRCVLAAKFFLGKKNLVIGNAIVVHRRLQTTNGFNVCKSGTIGSKRPIRNGALARDQGLKKMTKGLGRFGTPSWFGNEEGGWAIVGVGPRPWARPLELASRPPSSVRPQLSFQT